MGEGERWRVAFDVKIERERGKDKKEGEDEYAKENQMREGRVGQSLSASTGIAEWEYKVTGTGTTFDAHQPNRLHYMKLICKYADAPRYL